MDITILAIATAALLAAAGYAHYRIPEHTRGAGKRALTRTVLMVAGIGFGYVSAARVAPAGGLAALLVMLSGIGLVHVPAAIILFIKHRRGEGKS